ncbi:MAG: hypothetical protein WA766_11075 [Candidatus Acidiferrales bacterium]
MTPKVFITLQKVARMRVSGIRDGVIAAAVNMTQAGLSRILALPEYKELEAAVLDGTVSKMDEVLGQNAELMKKQFQVAVPVALRGLVEAAMQKKDLKTAIAACGEILDRDPDKRFVKDDYVHSQTGQPVSEAMIDSASKEADEVATAMQKKVPVQVM